MRATEKLIRVLAHYCTVAPNWLESEYQIPTRADYGIVTAAFAPPLPERAYIPERAFRYEDPERQAVWQLMYDNERERYLVLRIGLDDNGTLYHRYYAVPQQSIIAAALQALAENDHDGQVH